MTLYLVLTVTDTVAGRVQAERLARARMGTTLHPHEGWVTVKEAA